MHRLTSSFILAYHGCDSLVAKKLIDGAAFKRSDNDYDWLGPGIYFWESNPHRGLEWGTELAARKPRKINTPAVVGAVIDLGLCLDFTTSAGIELASTAYETLVKVTEAAGWSLPANSEDRLRRPLDCAVVRRIHKIREETNKPPVDTVRGVFPEGEPIYPGAGFDRKTHIQVAVRNPDCIKGVFRVPPSQLELP